MKKEENRVLVLGIFCSVCILTMAFLLTNGDTTNLTTSLKEIKPEVNVEITKDEEINQILVDPINMIAFENIQTNKTTVKDYEVTFSNESGKIEYTFYLENKSSTDTIVEPYTLPKPVCKGFQEDCEKVLVNLTYELKYEDNSNVVAGDVIKANEKKKVLLVLEYKADKRNMPSSTVDITNLGFELNFV